VKVYTFSAEYVTKQQLADEKMSLCTSCNGLTDQLAIFSSWSLSRPLGATNINCVAMFCNCTLQVLQWTRCQYLEQLTWQCWF